MYVSIQASLAAIAASADRFVVAWQSLGQDGDGYGVYAKRYTAAGVGASREQANVLTVVLLLGAADSAYEAARRIGEKDPEGAATAPPALAGLGIAIGLIGALVWHSTRLGWLDAWALRAFGADNYLEFRLASGISAGVRLLAPETLAAATTPRCPPPTATGLPLSCGSSRCSTDA